MERYTRHNDSIVARAGSGMQAYMAQVYGWMGCGLLLTAFIAWYVAKDVIFMTGQIDLAQSPILAAILLNKPLFYGLIIAQLGLVFVISGLVARMSGAMATGLFMLYSALMGLTLSSIFVMYTASSIGSTFFISAGMFGAMSLYGYTTKRDLSGMGSMLFMGLIGIILASVVNIFLNSPALMWAITYIGVVIFVGLTAYDTQKLRTMGETLSADDNPEEFRKASILGALTLYLDFINLFLMLLRIFGDRR